MALYARPSWRLARQILSDLFVVVWTVLWIQAGRWAYAAIMAVADPARQAAVTAEKLRNDFIGAAQQAGDVPLAGENLRKPFDSAATTMGDAIGVAQQQVATIEYVAMVAGILVVAIPVLMLLAVWLPARLRFARTSGAAQRFIDSDADLDLFALRAMANEPMHVLARISADPVGDWRAGDRRVITELADLELRRSGLSLPSAQRSPRNLPADRDTSRRDGAGPF